MTWPNTGMSLLVALMALWVPLAASAQVEPPRVAILDLDGLDQLDQREKAMLRQIDVVQQLREGLIDSRSFWVVARDEDSVGAIFDERAIAAADADPRAPQKVGLDTADFFITKRLIE